jgi:hypothetical protein
LELIYCEFQMNKKIIKVNKYEVCTNQTEDINITTLKNPYGINIYTNKLFCIHLKFTMYLIPKD